MGPYFNMISVLIKSRNLDIDLHIGLKPCEDKGRDQKCQRLPQDIKIPQKEPPYQHLDLRFLVSRIVTQ